MILHRKIKLFLKLLPLFLLLSYVYVITKSDQNAATGSESRGSGHSFHDLYMGKDSTSSSGLPLTQIREKIWQANQEEKLLNGQSFNPSTASAVIVVQVHNRARYLEGLIKSLSTVRGINNSLLIFSHDVYDEGINHMIAGITFCPVVQIFYPFSIQLFPDSFPGSDPHDCPRDMSPEKAKTANCLNARFPDTYGHYREASYTQTKHHWFWKVQ